MTCEYITSKTQHDEAINRDQYQAVSGMLYHPPSSTSIDTDREAHLTQGDIGGKPLLQSIDQRNQPVSNIWKTVSRAALEGRVAAVGCSAERRLEGLTHGGFAATHVYIKEVWTVRRCRWTQKPQAWGLIQIWAIGASGPTPPSDISARSLSIFSRRVTHLVDLR